MATKLNPTPIIKGGHFAIIMTGSHRGHEGESLRHGSLYLDGKQLGTWREGDYGGPMDFLLKDHNSLSDVLKRLDVECAQHQAAKQLLIDYPSCAKTGVWWEMVISTIATDIDLHKRLVRAAATKIVYKLNGDYMTVSTPYTPAAWEKFKQKYPAAELLNPTLLESSEVLTSK